MARTTLDTGSNGIQLQLEYGSLVDAATGGSITANTVSVKFSNLEAWIDANGYPFYDNSNKLTASGGWVADDSWTNIDIPTTSGTRKLKELSPQSQAIKFGGTNGSVSVSLTLTGINSAGTLSGSYSRTIPRRPYNAPNTPSVTIGDATATAGALQLDDEADRYTEDLTWELETDDVPAAFAAGAATIATRAVSMEADHRYRMAVAASNTDRTGPYGYSNYWYTEPAAPVMTGAARQATKTQVLIEWTNPSRWANVSVLERSDDGGTSWYQIFAGAALSYTDTVALNATPRYRVRLQTPVGENTAVSANSNELSIGLGWATPDAPANVSISGSGGNLLVSWTGAQYTPTADKYWQTTTIEVFDQANTLVASVSRAGTSNSLSVSVAAKPGFYARVRGSNPNGVGAWTTSGWMYNAPGVPGSFTAGRATPASATVLLAWTAASGVVDGYAIERGSSVAGPWTMVGITSGLSIEMTLSPAQTAWYRVRARTPSPMGEGASTEAVYVQVGLNTDRSKMPGCQRIYVGDERIVLVYSGVQRIWVDVDPEEGGGA